MSSENEYLEKCKAKLNDKFSEPRHALEDAIRWLIVDNLRRTGYDARWIQHGLYDYFPAAGAHQKTSPYNKLKACQFIQMLVDRGSSILSAKKLAQMIWKIRWEDIVSSYSFFIKNKEEHYFDTKNTKSTQYYCNVADIIAEITTLDSAMPKFNDKGLLKTKEVYTKLLKEIFDLIKDSMNKEEFKDPYEWSHDKLGVNLVKKWINTPFSDPIYFLHVISQQPVKFRNQSYCCSVLIINFFDVYSDINNPK